MATPCTAGNEWTARKWHCYRKHVSGRSENAEHTRYFGSTFFFSSFALFRFDNDGCTLDGRRRCLRSIRICAPTLLLWPWYGYPNREYTYSAVLLLLFSFYIRAISCTRNESYANTFDACSNDAEHDQPWRCYQLAHSKFYGVDDAVHRFG